MSGPPRQLPLIGREAELAVLLRRLADAGQGEGSVALVVGEPGIGKTRLLAELGERAQADGWTVLTGRAYETEGMPPYLPFIEALREHIRDCPSDRWRARLGRSAAEVALLVPELHGLLPDLPPLSAISPEQERYRLFEAVCDVLESIARGGETGLLLILDDLHWADAPSLRLLTTPRPPLGHRAGARRRRVSYRGRGAIPGIHRHAGGAGARGRQGAAGPDAAGPG